MKYSVRLAAAVFLCTSIFFNGMQQVFACGPFTLEPLFSLTKHADYPLLEYTKGKIGIVPTTYGRMTLYVFYRQLNDLSLTAEEQKQIVAAMENRIGLYSGDNADSSSDKSPEETPDYFAEWLAARAKITGEKINIETQKKIPDDYYYFTNCLPDSFRTATKTLEARISKYGNNDNLKEWLKGQDTVFSNCEAARALPETLGENFPEWLRKDRDYQLAAAKFYMGNFQAANEDFEKIATDENSDWSKTAKLVVARAYIRQASFVNETSESEKEQAEKEKTELLQKALLRLQNILDDNSMNEYHQSANRLLGLVKYRLIPQARKKELAERLVSNVENPNLYNDLIDYTWLLDNSQSQAVARGEEFERKQAEAEGKEFNYNYKFKLRDLPVDERQSDLTDWLFTFQAEDGFTHAFEKWKETGKTQWLAAAIVHTDVTTPQAEEILSAADKVPANSAAFSTIRFHQIRLLLETEKRAGAKRKLDQIFTNNFKNLPLSSQNKFLAQRMSLAENLDEFLKYAQRKPVTFIWSDDENESGTNVKDDKQFGDWANRTMFDEDSAEIFNTKIPLSVLRQAALNPQLPEHLKKFLVVAVWTRAFVLGDKSIEREFTPLMSRYAKEFSPLFSKYANAINAVNSEAAALETVLRYPVMQPFVPVGFGRDTDPPDSIDSNRGNWWCAEYKYENDYYGDEDKSEQKKTVSLQFLTQAQISAAENENRQMKALGNAATFLARRAVEFASRNPNHPQTPEILHFAVRATRYGCADEQTLKFSKQAFKILHKRYPNSVWTKKTPYYFGS